MTEKNYARRPTPMRVDRRKTHLENYATILDAEGRFVADVTADAGVAEHVMMCVNAHDELLSAVQAGRRYQLALQKRVVDGAINIIDTGGAVAMGDDLDALANDWETKTLVALQTQQAQQVQQERPLTTQTPPTPPPSGPWVVGYENDVGPHDESFREWWTVSRGQQPAIHEEDVLAKCSEKKDAAFIAERLNLHDELIEALKSAAFSLEALVKINRVPPSSKGLADARAALKKAGAL